MFSLVNVVLKRWVLIGIATLSVFLLLAIPKLLLHRSYSVTAAFMPQAKRAGASGAAGLAAQLGIDLGGSDASSSPQFYLRLLDSRQILGPVAETKYTFVQDGKTVTSDLISMYGVGNSPAARRESGIQALRGSVSTSISFQTGIVSMTVRAPAPDLALQIANRLLEEIAKFNLESRRTRAGSERSFAERRFAESAAELREAENKLQLFLQQNRQVEGSPGLQFERDRLTREIVMKQQLNTSLALAYEQAKIEEVRDTPTFTVIEPPELPAGASGRGVIRSGLVGIVVGFILGVMLAFAREYLSREHSRATGDFEQSRILLRQAAQDLLHPIRALKRWRRAWGIRRSATPRQS